MSVVLVGMPAAGKTTVGGLLAERLSVPFVDLDKYIETDARRTVAEIFTTDGEAVFRELEASAIAEILAAQKVVLSLGGGAVTNPQVRAAIAAHTVVWLQVSLRASLLRVGKTQHRPLLAGNTEEQLRMLMAQRSAIYDEVADITVQTTRRRPSQVVTAIQLALTSCEISASTGFEESATEAKHG